MVSAVWQSPILNWICLIASRAECETASVTLPHKKCMRGSVFFLFFVFFYLAFPFDDNDRYRGGRPAVLSRKRLVTVPQNYHLHKGEQVRLSSHHSEHNMLIPICLTTCTKREIHQNRSPLMVDNAVHVEFKDLPYNKALSQSLLMFTPQV